MVFWNIENRYVVEPSNIIKVIVISLSLKLNNIERKVGNVYVQILSR